MLLQQINSVQTITILFQLPPHTATSHAQTTPNHWTKRDSLYQPKNTFNWKPIPSFSHSHTPTDQFFPTRQKWDYQSKTTTNFENYVCRVDIALTTFFAQYTRHNRQWETQRESKKARVDVNSSLTLSLSLSLYSPPKRHFMLRQASISFFPLIFFFRDSNRSNF